MWVVYVLLAVVALVLLLLSLPVVGRITYDGELTVYARILGIRVTLYPEEQEKTEPQTKRRTKKKKPSKLQELKELLRQDDVAGTLRFIGDVAKLVKRAAGRFLRAVTVTHLQLQMLIATGDPADTAQLYGQVCGVLYPALETIAYYVRIRRRQVRVEPNFLLDKSQARFDIRLRISLWRLIGVIVTLLWGFLLLRNEDALKEVS